MFQFVRATLFALIGVVLVAAATAPPDPPSPLAAAIAATQAARAAYAFDMDLNSSKLNWRMHFDPSTTPHLQLQAPSRASLNNDQQHMFDRAAQQIDGLSWCASEYMAHVADLHATTDDAESTTYAFQPTPESIRSEQTRRYVAQLRGELTLTKSGPDIARIHIFAPAPFSPALMTQITRIDIVTTCTPAPNGRLFASQTVTQIAGSALGQAFSEQSIQRVHDVAAR